MAEDIGTTVATEVTSNIVKLLTEVSPQDRSWEWKTNHVIKLENELSVLDSDFSRVKGLLIHISNQYQARQERFPQPVKRCLERICASLREAINLIDETKRQQDRGGCVPCRCEGGVSSKIRVWKARFDALLQELQRAADIGTTIAAEVTSNIVKLLTEVTPQDRSWESETNHVIKLAIELSVLDRDFSRVKGLLIHISNQYQARQKRLPQPVERCLERIRASLREAINLIDETKRQQDRGGCLPCRREGGVSSKIRVWKARFDALLQELQTVLSISSNSGQIVSSAARLLQPVPDSAFVGSGIQSNREKLQKWLGETRPEARVIGVYGAGGVGKTSLLRIIYTSYKKEVSRFFDVVIWVTMSQKYGIEQLQGSIAKALNLSLEETATAEAKKMKLSESLERKKVLLILDNVRQEIDLNEAGVKIEDNNGSKLLISSGSIDVIEKIGAKMNYSLEIKLLSAEDGWDLFRRGAFENGVVPENIRDKAREIATNCKGLPLTINAVAAAMRFKNSRQDWSDALYFMKKTDPSFPTNQRQRRTIDAESYQLLRWIYKDMSDQHPHVKNCFLTCAAFLEDKEIAVDKLVGMWDAEGLLNRAETPAKTPDSTEGLQSRTETADLMDVGRQIINVLVSRCLVEYVNPIVDDDYHSVEYVKIHEVFRDMAIDIGQRDEKCLFEAGQQLQNFPTEKVPRECRRISVAHNVIRNLPNDLNCPELESLVLASNIPLEKVPDGFFSNARSLKVLDLSCTSITTLPKLEQLKQLQFLNLSSCSKLVDLPDSVCSVLSLKGLDLSRTSIRTLRDNVCNLSGLQVLNLNSCSELQTLPDEVVELKSLKQLKLDACFSLMKIPKNLSQLTSLDTLILPLMESTCAMSVKDLSNLSNLVELTTVVKSDNADMEPWSKMRNLTLEYEDDENADRVEVARPEHVILRKMRKMKEMQNFHLINYQGETLPNSICKLQKMKLLLLRSCYHLVELPALDQIRSESAGGCSQSEAFPALDQSRSEGAGDPSQSEALPALDQIRSESTGDSSQSEGLSALDQIMSESAGDSFPMLEKLVLKHLLKLQRIAGPSAVWIEGAMSKLQLLVIINCPLLQSFPEGMKLPQLKELYMTMCNEFMELDIGSGGFPLLELLALDELNKLKSIAGPRPSESIAGPRPSEWNEGTMSKLQIVEIIGCPSLKTLPVGMEKLPSLKQINGELDWWERLTWKNDEIKIRLSQLFMII